MTDAVCPALIASGARQGMTCGRTAWKPNQYGAYCRYHYRLYSASTVGVQGQSIETGGQSDRASHERKKKVIESAQDNTDANRMHDVLFEAHFIMQAREIQHCMMPVSAWLQQQHRGQRWNWSTLCWDCVGPVCQ